MFKKLIPFMALLLFSAFTQVEQRNCVEMWAARTVGIREASGSNDGLYVEKFLKLCKSTKGNAWCGCFVYSAMLNCQVLKDSLPDCPAWSPCWMQSSKLIWKQGQDYKTVNIRKGDVFGLYYSSRGRVAHVGLVISVNKEEGYVLTIEGNTSDIDNLMQPGDGVHIKKRKFKEIYAIADWISRRAAVLPAPANEVSDNYSEHVVQKKETLYAISRLYNTTPEKLKVCNGIRDNTIYIGQELIICH